MTYMHDRAPPENVMLHRISMPDPKEGESNPSHSQIRVDSRNTRVLEGLGEGR